MYKIGAQIADKNCQILLVLQPAAGSEADGLHAFFNSQIHDAV